MDLRHELNGASDTHVADAAEPALPPDSLLTAEEVAALLQVTCAWVYAQTRKRRIPHLRLGRYVRYRRGRWTLDGGHGDSATLEHLSPVR